MFNSPSPASPSSPARWFLPVLTLLTVLGIVSIGAWLGREEARPAIKTIPSTQGQPSQVAGSQTSVAQAPASTPIPQSNVPAVQPMTNPAPVAASQTGSTSAPVASSMPSLPVAASVAGLTDPPSTGQALDPGEPARLRATVGGARTPLLSPNQVGSFPRVYLPLGGQADVQMQLPEAAPGDQVVVAVEDGGNFANGKPVQAFTLDENRQVAFQFQASQSLGTFRVSMRHNAQTKVVTFWAGERTAAFNY